MLNKVNKQLNIAKLFVKKMFGENSPSETEELNEWTEAHRKVADDIYNWDKFTERQIDISQINTDKEWSNLQHRLNKERSDKRIDFWKFTKYAAAASVVIVFGLYLSQYESDDKKINVVTVEAPIVVKENPNGVKSQILLPDGTHVWLNSASSISYFQRFSDSERLISLRGEAYFEVVKDKKRPFRVKSGNTTTTALGTSFNINAYDTSSIQISINTGIVDVTTLDNNEHIILNPGEQVYTDNSGLSIKKFSRESVLAWKDGTLYFENTDFDEMIDVLEKWYDVSFEVKNLSGEKRSTLKVTGKFKNQTLVSVLKLLRHSLNFEYNVDQNNVTLKF